MNPSTPDSPDALPDFHAAEFARRWKDVWTGDVDWLERVGAKQKVIIDGASEAWLRALLREVPPKVLWGFLNPKPKEDFDRQRVELRQIAFKGFQPVQTTLRLPAVGHRLVAWMEKHRDGAHVLLLLWGQGLPDLVRALDETLGDDELLGVVRKYGALPSWVGAAFVGSSSLFERIEELLKRPEALERAVEEAPAEVNVVTEGEVANPELETVEYWREQALQLQSELEVQGRELRAVKEENTELETLRERLRASQRELDKAHKEERQRETAWQKKFEIAQKTAQAQLNELKKHDDRESRRLSAAEKMRDELDSTVKVLRKQVRHLNQLLDEHQKKIAALEARLAEREPVKSEGDAQAVEAVPTPPSPQKALKVARPTPLDEVFRWVADGHEFRATPREAMRCIDRGDEDFAFRAQLALEGVSPKDVAKKNAFLTRLREQDGYYVRVLTEPTQRALVDASNVVRSTKNRYGKGELKNLMGMKKELRRLGFFPIEMIADASLRYNVDEINPYNEMINRGEVEVVVPGMEADEVLVRKARSGGGYVVTNDGKFHFKVSPDLAPPSITFRVFAGTVIIDEF